jgi:hypothetical protein
LELKEKRAYKGQQARKVQRVLRGRQVLELKEQRAYKEQQVLALRVAPVRELKDQRVYKDRRVCKVLRVLKVGLVLKE